MKAKKIMGGVLCLLLMGGGVLIASDARADFIKYLTISNENLGISGNFAKVTVTVSGDTANFVVDVDTILLPDGAVQTFGFNFKGGITLAASDFSLPTNWSANTSGSVLDGFGRFENVVSTSGDNDRKDPLSFSITRSGYTFTESDFNETNNKGYIFAAHIAGFTKMGPDSKTSAWFADGTPVPEPATILLVGSALISMALIRRRTK